MESTMTLLDPSTNILEIAANHVSSHILKKIDFKKELSTSGKQVWDAANHSLRIPVQLSEVFSTIMKGRLKINLEIMDSTVPLTTVNHMVNKLTVGVVSAGLLMASSILCTTQMTPKIFGIPALGFIGYITAIGLGLWLLATVLLEKRKRK